jgi:hypothetical protein
MVWLALGLAALFFGLAFLISTETALRRTSGADRWTADEKAAFDVAGYVKLWRRFHFVLAAVLVALAAVAAAGIQEVGAAIGLLPLLGYTGLIVAFRKFMPRREQTGLLVAGATMALTTVGVGILLFAGSRPSVTSADGEGLHISGMYGPELGWSELQSCTALPLDSLPEIRRRVHGFADGVRRKGRFSTAEGERVTLLLDGTEGACVRIVPVAGPVIYLGVADRLAADSLAAAWETLRTAP